MARIDRRAIGTGAALGLAVLAFTIVAFGLVDRAAGIGWRSNWVFLFYAVAFAGLVAGGRLAARRRPEAPLVHGVVAALAAYAVVAVLDIVVGAMVGAAADPVGLAFNALMAASAGTLGTLIAERSASRPPRPSATS
ncbi:MAG: hypothetical protein ACRD12_18005 [Acidimicrobiales bacterium]